MLFFPESLLPLVIRTSQASGSGGGGGVLPAAVNVPGIENAKHKVID